MEGFYVPTDWLQFNVGFAYINAQYKEGQSTESNLLTDCDRLSIPCDKSGLAGFVTSGDLAGLVPPGTPETSFNAGMQIDWPLFQSNWAIQGRLDYSWQDRIFIDDANAGFIPERQTVNLRLGIEDGHWSIAGFCNNIGNDDTPIFALPPRDILGVPHYAVVNRDERLCGMQVSFRS